MNAKGISALFLVIALLLVVSVGYVLSYLIPIKQKSVIFPIYSNQAFFIAQSGVEYAIRYGSEQGWRQATDLQRLNNPGVNQRNLGKGRFTILYNRLTDSLTSTGEITGSGEKRIVSVSNFTQFSRLILDPASPPPCWSSLNRRARFYIKNVRADNVTLTAFSATWTQTGTARRITRIDMNGVQKFNGNYRNGNPPANFNRGGGSQTIIPNQVINSLIYWNGDVTNGANFIVTFYTGTGESYAFNLDADGDGLPSC